MPTYRPTTRRAFLTQVGTLAVAAGTAPMWLDMVNGTTSWALGETDTLPVGTPVCVHIALDGGNDYLNMLAPVGDGWYADTATGHGSIALTEADTLALTGTNYRLHKNLAWLADRWNSVGDVGFAVGVGELNKHNFSHFDSQKYWETGAVGTGGWTGWLGRYCDIKEPGNALASISIADVRLDAIGASAPTLVVQDCSKFSWDPAWLDPAMYTAAAKKMATIDGASPVADVSRMLTTTFAVTDRIKGAADATITGTSPQNYAWITQQLLQAALLVRAGIPSQTYTLAVGGYDSHVNQPAMQSARFNELNEGLTKFFAALVGHPRENDVFVLITSEFGRQMSANKDNGTDHGQAGMAVFIGGGTRRGIFGAAPTLDPGGLTRPNRINDALKPTVDFRSVHATALNRLARGDSNVSQQVLSGSFEDLGVFAAPPPPATTTTTVPPTTTTTVPPTTTTTVPPTTTTTAPPVNKPPTAVMRLSKTSGKAPLTVGASSAGSKDPDGTIVSYRWTWGDGASNTGGTASHKFMKRGSYVVQLTVTDNKGATGQASQSVTVF